VNRVIAMSPKGDEAIQEPAISASGLFGFARNDDLIESDFA